MACCGDMGLPIVTQPGDLRQHLAAAGKNGPVAVVYQPRGGDVSEHFEYVAWMCIKAQNIVLMADEVDMICSANAPLNARSAYWKKSTRPAALGHIVHFGRHCRMAFVAISRRPQDTWRGLRGQASRMLVFTMSDDLEMDAVRMRLGSNADSLPTIPQYHYLDWHDGGTVTVEGGRL